MAYRQRPFGRSPCSNHVGYEGRNKIEAREPNCLGKRDLAANPLLSQLRHRAITAVS